MFPVAFFSFDIEKDSFVASCAKPIVRRWGFDLHPNFQFKTKVQISRPNQLQHNALSEYVRTWRLEKKHSQSIISDFNNDTVENLGVATKNTLQPGRRDASAFELEQPHKLNPKTRCWISRKPKKNLEYVESNHIACGQLLNVIFTSCNIRKGYA